MELIAAVLYVLSVYVALPMWLFGAWARGEQRRDPVRQRGIARIRREIERRRAGRVDTDE